MPYRAKFTAVVIAVCILTITCLLLARRSRLVSHPTPVSGPYHTDDTEAMFSEQAEERTVFSAPHTDSLESLPQSKIILDAVGTEPKPSMPSSFAARALLVKIQRNNAAPNKEDHSAAAIPHGRTAQLDLGSECSPQVLQSHTLNAQGHMTPVSKRRTGYILSLSFREQQTRAAESLFSLQCWAKTLSAHVVEPFVQESHLLVPADDSQHRLPRFSELFDINAWGTLSTKYGFAPLASWEKFLAEAPRQLIVVHFNYSNSLLQKSRKLSGTPLTHLALNDGYKKWCTPSYRLGSQLSYLSQRNFTIVREVCFNFYNGDELTLYQFNRHLYGSFAPREVTVLMEEWRGLNTNVNGKRVIVNDACWTSVPLQPSKFIVPSQKLRCDAKAYKHKYLRTDSYIAVIVRTEKIRLLGSDPSRIPYCLQKTLEVLSSMKKKRGINLVFLSMDIGKFGSSTIREEDARPYAHTYEDFVRKIYGPSASIGWWESTFESVTDVRDSGYIGTLQKTLVVKSRCILFVGGGSFQKHAKLLYQRLNSDKKKLCIEVVKGCTRL